MDSHPFSVRTSIQSWGLTYTYWELRAYTRLARLEIIWLMLVALAVKD
jgi:hypothetical protein